MPTAVDDVVAGSFDANFRWEYEDGRETSPWYG